MAKKKKGELVLAGADYDSLLARISSLLEQGRRATVRTVNAILSATYWEVGRQIVEYEAAGHSPKLAPKEESMGVLILELDGNGRKKVARAQLYLDTAHWQTLTGG